MKTIRELKNEGLISTRLYSALIRGITFDNKFKVVNKTFKWIVDYPNGNDLTAKDICELWTDDEILKWRGMGQETFKELKSLI